MSDKCSDADCRYPGCTCWQDKHSQSVERILKLEAELESLKKAIRNFVDKEGSHRIPEYNELVDLAELREGEK